MGKSKGFLKYARAKLPKRPIAERVRDWNEVEGSLPPEKLRNQAARCMDCGVPFCHQGCPLGNYIPDWNDLVFRDAWREAIDRLHATNNFPEFTGRTCPAPCEEACVLNINDDPVTIKQIEKQLVDRAWAEGWIAPQPAGQRTGRRVAVVGSGPAGLACAQQLARAGHDVTVFERDDKLGGLLRYGIPDFKMEKSHIDRRIEQMTGEGVTFRTGVDVGRTPTVADLREGFDAVCLATGAQRPRDLPVPGRELRGVHFAMEYLTQQNQAVAGDPPDDQLHAGGKRVVVLGGGDTGADCLGTAIRQGATEVMHFHYKPAPPESRTADQPWPWYPMILRDSTSHQEGGIRGWSVVATGFSGTETGRLTTMHCQRVDWVGGKMIELADGAFDLPVDLALIAVGFDGPEPGPLFRDLGFEARARIPSNDRFATPAPGVFACGDARRGASLVVWAIWEGREAARAIDEHLMGRSELPTVPNRHPL
jgi:glutamate synthase (NADPH/NADH) small chain